jgi:tight adherence protein B
VIDTLVPAVLGFGVVVGLVGFVLLVRHHAPTTEAAPRPSMPRRERSRQALIAGAAAIGVLALTRWPVGAAFAAFATLFAPRVFGGRASRTEALARTEGIATWAEMLRDTMAAAAGLEETIVATTAVAPESIRADLRAFVARLERHRLAPSLRELAHHLDDPTGDLAAAALIIAAEKPVKDLGGMLGSLASSARERCAMQLRVEAGRARTRTAVRMVTLFTVGFATAMLVLNRGYLDPFNTVVGQMMMLIIGGLFTAAFVLLDRMARGVPTERILVRATPAEGRA